MNGKDRPLTDYYLFPGDIYLRHEPSLVSVVLGSCVAVSIWRSEKLLGGMVHYHYPYTADRRKATADYGNVALNRLIKMLLDEGAKAKHLKAQIFGGALNGSAEGIKIARENIRIARTVLTEQHIMILSEDTGGYMGRKVVYNTNTNETLVYRANTLRKGDWYPYDEG